MWSECFFYKYFFLIMIFSSNIREELFAEFTSYPLLIFPLSEKNLLIISLEGMGYLTDLYTLEN